jgi:hypothetical protein
VTTACVSSGLNPYAGIFRPFAKDRGESTFAASHAVSVRGRSVRRPKSRNAAFLSPIPSRSGPNFSAVRPPGEPWHEKQPYLRNVFSPASASVRLTRSGSRMSLGASKSRNSSSMYATTSRDSASLKWYWGIGVRGLNACGSRTYARSQPRVAADATFESSGAEPWPLPSTVWHEMHRASENSFLPLAGSPAGSFPAARTALARSSGMSWPST